jgi:hypothetical protein
VERKHHTSSHNCPMRTLKYPLCLATDPPFHGCALCRMTVIYSVIARPYLTYKAVITPCRVLQPNRCIHHLHYQSSRYPLGNRDMSHHNCRLRCTSWSKGVGPPLGLATVSDINTEPLAHLSDYQPGLILHQASIDKT